MTAKKHITDKQIEAMDKKAVLDLQQQLSKRVDAIAEQERVDALERISEILGETGLDPEELRKFIPSLTPVKKQKRSRKPKAKKYRLSKDLITDGVDDVFYSGSGQMQKDFAVLHKKPEYSKLSRQDFLKKFLIEE